MNIEHEINLTVPAVVVKATGRFIVAGKMVKPGGLAQVSELEARNLFARNLAEHAVLEDIVEGVEIPASGTIDSETLKTLVTDAKAAIQHAPAIQVDEAPAPVRGKRGR